MFISNGKIDLNLLFIGLIGLWCFMDCDHFNIVVNEGELLDFHYCLRITMFSFFCFSPIG